MALACVGVKRMCMRPRACAARLVFVPTLCNLCLGQTRDRLDGYTIDVYAQYSRPENLDCRIWGISHVRMSEARCMFTCNHRHALLLTAPQTSLLMA